MDCGSGMAFSPRRGRRRRPEYHLGACTGARGTAPSTARPPARLRRATASAEEPIIPEPSTRRFSIVESHEDRDLASFAEEIEAGFAARPRRIPCRFLYDETGSKLFEQICDLPEYYLTRAEREILEARAGELAAHFAGPITLAELGSGSATKTRLLIEAFLAQHGRLRYLPVDISRSILEESSLALAERYDGLEIRAIAGEYQAGLRHVRAASDRARLIAWLGSNVGNLTREEAEQFLGGVRAALSPRDRLLIGVDLRKPRRDLERAYDDSRGITARFTLNLLQRINRELGADFDLGGFRHRAVYDERLGRVDIHLVSQRAQRVSIARLGRELEFGEGEAIHAESSYKYSRGEIAALAAGARLALERHWVDAGGRFSVNLLRPV